MIHRTRTGLIVIAFSIIITLLSLSFDDFQPEVTGFVVREDSSESGVLLRGQFFEAHVDGKEYYYIFTHDSEWFESKEPFIWEKRDDMGNSIWDGLTYLLSYEAVIYYNDLEIRDLTDITKLAEELR